MQNLGLQQIRIRPVAMRVLHLPKMVIAPLLPHLPPLLPLLLRWNSGSCIEKLSSVLAYITSASTQVHCLCALLVVHCPFT